MQPAKQSLPPPETEKVIILCNMEPNGIHVAKVQAVVDNANANKIAANWCSQQQRIKKLLRTNSPKIGTYDKPINVEDPNIHVDLEAPITLKIEENWQKIQYEPQNLEEHMIKAVEILGILEKIYQAYYEHAVKMTYVTDVKQKNIKQLVKDGVHCLGEQLPKLHYINGVQAKTLAAMSKALQKMQEGNLLLGNKSPSKKKKEKKKRQRTQSETSPEMQTSKKMATSKGEKSNSDGLQSRPQAKTAQTQGGEQTQEPMDATPGSEVKDSQPDQR